MASLKNIEYLRHLLICFVIYLHLLENGVVQSQKGLKDKNMDQKYDDYQLEAGSSNQDRSGKTDGSEINSVEEKRKRDDNATDITRETNKLSKKINKKQSERHKKLVHKHKKSLPPPSSDERDESIGTEVTIEDYKLSNEINKKQFRNHDELVRKHKNKKITDENKQNVTKKNKNKNSKHEMNKKKLTASLTRKMKGISDEENDNQGKWSWTEWGKWSKCHNYFDEEYKHRSRWCKYYYGGRIFCPNKKQNFKSYRQTIQCTIPK